MQNSLVFASQNAVLFFRIMAAGRPCRGNTPQHWRACCGRPGVWQTVPWEYSPALASVLPSAVHVALGAEKATPAEGERCPMIITERSHTHTPRRAPCDRTRKLNAARRSPGIGPNGGPRASPAARPKGAASHGHWPSQDRGTALSARSAGQARLLL